MTLGLANKRGRPPRLTVEWLSVCRRLREDQNFSYQQIADYLPFPITSEAVRLALTKENDPADATGEANDQSRDETHQDDRNSPDSTSVAMTKGDKAS